MFKKFIFFKKYKLKQLKKIKQTSKYIYFFRYNDLKINEIIVLKKNMKKFSYQTLIANQKLTDQIFPKIEGQGSLLIIYGNKNLNLIKNLINFKKLNLIFLIFQNTIYSSLKIKNILNQNHLFLNNLIIQPIFNFIYLLKKI